MAASLSIYNNWREAINDAALRAATVKLTLHTFAYTFAATHSVYADLTNELATANGYTSGGATLASVVWDQMGANLLFDAADTVWTASGGSIVHRRAVLRVVGTFNGLVDPLIASILSNVSPADIITTTGNPLIFVWNASVIFPDGVLFSDLAMC